MTEAENKPSQRDQRFAEMRAAPRSSLMCRTGKILCDSGEYVCIVRDVSTTGARLKLFHAPPPDRHVFLELANGDRYAMERIWEDGDHAGFRFSCVIDVDRFIAEPSPYPRRPIRLKLQHPAEIAVGGESSAVMLLDLSQQGARIEAGRRFALEQKLSFEVEGLPPRFGAVRWRKAYAHGLVLQQGLKLEQLAQYALALQPFGVPDPSLSPALPPARRYA